MTSSLESHVLTRACLDSRAMHFVRQPARYRGGALDKREGATCGDLASFSGSVM